MAIFLSPLLDIWVTPLPVVCSALPPLEIYPSRDQDAPSLTSGNSDGKTLVSRGGRGMSHDLQFIKFESLKLNKSLYSPVYAEA